MTEIQNLVFLVFPQQILLSENSQYQISEERTEHDQVTPSLLKNIFFSDRLYKNIKNTTFKSLKKQ